MTVFLKTLSAILAVGLIVSSCASSSTSSKNGTKTELADKKASKTKAVKAKQIKTVQTGLTQRPNENIIAVNGKITRTGEVYLLRGLANVFSRGMDALGAKMAKRGLDARVYNHGAWQDLADNIVARSKRKEVSYPIVIMGHSLGANAAPVMANYLAKRGVKVSYVVAFDPTLTRSVGKGVGRTVNFYLPNKEKNNIIKRTSGRGLVKNINVTGVRGLSHTTVEKDAKFHEEVIKRTISYTKKRRKKRR